MWSRSASHWSESDLEKMSWENFITEMQHVNDSITATTPCLVFIIQSIVPSVLESPRRIPSHKDEGMQGNLGKITMKSRKQNQCYARQKVSTWLSPKFIMPAQSISSVWSHFAYA